MPVSEERMAALEERTSSLEARVAWLDQRVWDRSEPRAGAVAVAPREPRAGERTGTDHPSAPTLEVRPAPPARAAVPSAVRPRPAAPRARPSFPRADAASWEDVVGGRVLGWVGGVAVLLGLVLFLVVAASRGWIDEEARVVMAGVCSLVLLGAGARLHERRGRTDAACAAAATGVAGLFATTVVAGPVYELVPTLASLGSALAVGACATVLALRWSAPGIGWLGILGALVSPALLGAAGDGLGIALMLVAYAAAGAVLLWQRWHALAGAAFVATVAQLGWWLFDQWGDGGPATAAVVAALTVFGVVTAAAATGFEWRAGAARLRVSAHVLLALNALALAALGAIALDETATDIWLAALAVAHLGAGLGARQSARVTRELALAAAGLGIVLADVAFASVADGLPLVLGWAAGAVGFSALARAADHRSDSVVALAGVGGHLLLAIATTLTGTAPLSAVGDGGGDQAAALTALAALATSAWAAARALAPRLPDWRLGLDAIALAALGLFSAVALDGLDLTLALAAESGALAALARRGRTATARQPLGDAATANEPLDDQATAEDPLPFAAALAFLSIGLGHALFVLAPPAALIAGLEQPLQAAIALSAVAAAAVLTGRAAPRPDDRTALHAGAAVLALYLASTLVVTPFQPGADMAALPLAQLDVRQQGQALLSAMWALTGVAALVAGLVRDRRTLRLGALALLTVTAGKVFVFDLASLTSLYRVGSCVALGLLLLAGAFAWQRIRPRALPDLRGVPTALR